MQEQPLIIKKSKPFRNSLIIITFILFISTLLFIPTVTVDKDSMIFVMVSVPLTILMTLFTIGQWCYKIQLDGKNILYINGLLIKKELHTSQLTASSVNDSKGVTVYDQEQKKLFFIPVRSEKCIDFLIYLKQQGVALQFNRPDSTLEKAINQTLSGANTYSKIPLENYYVEKPSRKLKKFRIIPVILSILLIVLFLLLSKINDTFIRTLLFSGIFIFAGLHTLITIIIRKLMRRNILCGAVSLPARIAQFNHLRAAIATPVYEFEDENGLHQLPGFDSIRLKHSAEKELMDKPRLVLYNAQFPTAVIDADPFIDKADSFTLPCIATGILFIIATILLALSFFIWDIADIPDHISVGTAKPWVEQDYKKGALTQDDVDSDTVQWICSTYAIYTELNNKELGRIGGAAEDDEAIKVPIKAQLNDGWNISDRKSAVSKINQLVNVGHRKQYKSLLERMEKDGLLNLSRNEFIMKLLETDDYNQYLTAYDAYKQFGEKALDAWDYCRALQVLGDCYQSGYISLTECLDKSLSIAKELQKDFDSWDEIADSYLYGFQFWKKDAPGSSVSQTSSRRDIYTDFKDAEDGPFSIAYDTKLKNTWKNAKKGGNVTKSDAKEYYTVEYERSKGRTFVKPLEGFQLSDDASDTYLLLIKRKEGSSQTAQVSMSVTEIFDDTEEYLKTNAKHKSENFLENTENIDFHDIQETEINGIKITYIYYNYESYNRKNKMCQMWWTMDGKYMITADVSENIVPLDGSFVFDDSTMVQTIFDCIKK